MSVPSTQEKSLNDEKDLEASGSAGVLEVLDLDETAKEIIQGSEGQYSEADFKRVLRKIDLILLPVMWICYGVQQADKTSLATQATFGLQTSTKLVGQQYAWLTTIFYIAYLVAEFPAQYALQRINVGKSLAIFIVIWGIIVMCVGFAKNWTDLMVLRALQGVFECTISPAFLLITGSFYLKKEQALRTLIWGTANAGFGIIIALVEYGIGTHIINNPGAVTAWQAISFLLGPLTIVLGVLAYFTLGTTNEVMWLSAEDKKIAMARVVSNQTGTDSKKRPWVWAQVGEAFMDPQTYFFMVCMIVSSLPNGGITSFGKLVYTSFGFTNLEVLVKGTIPQNLLSVAWFLIVGYFTQKWPGLRFYFMIAGLIPAFVGFLVLGHYTGTAGNLWLKWGMFLLTVLGNLSGVMIWTFLPSNVAGRTKKTVVSTLLFFCYCAGNAGGAQIFNAKDAPYYKPAIVTCAALLATQIALFVMWRSWYVYMNYRRDKAAERDGISLEEREHQGKILAESDATDLLGNRHFRYTY